MWTKLYGTLLTAFSFSGVGTHVIGALLYICIRMGEKNAILDLR